MIQAEMHILIERLIQANTLILMETQSLNADQMFEVQNLQRKQRQKELEEKDHDHENYEGGDRQSNRKPSVYQRDNTRNNLGHME